MGPRDFPGASLIWMADEIRIVQRERLATGQNYRVYQGAGRASSQDEFQGGICRVVKEASLSLRRAVFVGVSQPSLRDCGLFETFATPTLKGWAMFSSSLRDE